MVRVKNDPWYNKIIKHSESEKFDALGYNESIGYNAINIHFECDGWKCGTLTEALKIHKSSGAPIETYNNGVLVE